MGDLGRSLFQLEEKYWTNIKWKNRIPAKNMTSSIQYNKISFIQIITTKFSCILQCVSQLKNLVTLSSRLTLKPAI